MDSLKENIKNVVKWGDERGITFSANIKAQTLKVVEELGETFYACYNEDVTAVKDGIGDSLVTLIILSKQIDYDFTDSLDYLTEKIHFKKENCLTELVIQGFLLAKNTLKQDTDKVISNIRAIVSILSDLSYHYQTSLDECLQVAWDVIKDRKGRTIDGTFIKESDLK